MSTYSVHGRGCNQACTLERPAYFLVFLQHQNLQPFLAEERGSPATNGPCADDNDIVVMVVHAFACGRYCFNLPLAEVLRSTFSEFVADGLVLFQVELCRKRIVGFL